MVKHTLTVKPRSFMNSVVDSHSSLRLVRTGKKTAAAEFYK
ncbi:hypothetical protein BN1221_01137 [Brenneria goodwinii]|uniref:Uncharacterized protein n=1 Tax=Brenneria goodwinii TaxID=1109412 RepID=A0A0G4JSR9_9GAMM|nr:hypothetical protein BN1221_01137 [Brenneria goodwinii]